MADTQGVNVSRRTRLIACLVHASGLCAFWIPGLYADYQWRKGLPWLRRQARRAIRFQFLCFMLLATVAAASAVWPVLFRDSVHRTAESPVTGMATFRREGEWVLAIAQWVVLGIWQIGTLLLAAGALRARGTSAK
ncbi:MAG: hypothetical protein ACP5O1_05210 [Phycisphaerae bacterium]